MGVAATGRLTGEPESVGLAHRGPRLVGTHGTARHLVDVALLVVLAREREVHADVGLNFLGDEVNNLLRIGRVPHVDMHQPERML